MMVNDIHLQVYYVYIFSYFDHYSTQQNILFFPCLQIKIVNLFRVYVVKKEAAKGCK